MGTMVGLAVLSILYFLFWGLVAKLINLFYVKMQIAAYERAERRAYEAEHYNWPEARAHVSQTDQEQIDRRLQNM